MNVHSLPMGNHIYKICKYSPINASTKNFCRTPSEHPQIKYRQNEIIIANVTAIGDKCQNYVEGIGAMQHFWYLIRYPDSLYTSINYFHEVKSNARAVCIFRKRRGRLMIPLFVFRICCLGLPTHNLLQHGLQLRKIIMYCAIHIFHTECLVSVRRNIAHSCHVFPRYLRGCVSCLHADIFYQFPNIDCCHCQRPF